MQSTRGYSFFLAQTYNIHLVAGWDPDWMRFTPKTNHSGVHLEMQWDQLLQRSCDHCVHTCTSEPHKVRKQTRVWFKQTKHHTCALCGYILKALISVWFSRSHSLSPYECAVVYSSLVLLFCASLVVSRSTLQTCRMRSSQTHTKNTRWCLAAHVLCYVHSLSGFHYLADNSHLTSALCSSSGPAYYLWSRILCLCWLKGKLMWEFKAAFSAHPKTRSKVKNYRRSSSCTDIMDEK